MDNDDLLERYASTPDAGGHYPSDDDVEAFADELADRA